ncbi:MAG: SET domain-containing protein-lysine N-methyltransferase [Verrucomicrobiales bacterium]|nr:SET domain-containing protein [Verrucomicrobiae bacterium]MCP5554713.1 SET domain-containing protein [Akkermansiaceae bacterium]HRX54150.1 SET domain-containing protein-lysine N-methyltransferase [Verrucomicrobiales bacterium]
MEPRLFLQANHLGVGVYARKSFEIGEEILVFHGMEVFGKDAAASPHTLQISSYGYLDVDPPGRYVNHSCLPNAGITAGNTLIAITPLHAGMEITFDYSTTMMAENTWLMECACGAKNCRGLIEDFDRLPFNLQNHYFKLGVVSDFVAERLGRQTRHQRLHRMLVNQALRSLPFPDQGNLADTKPSHQDPYYENYR